MIRLFKRLILLTILIALLVYLGSLLLIALGGAFWQKSYDQAKYPNSVARD